MMLSVSPSSIVRSSLEEMLDSLRRKEEEDKPRDLPPALPARPTSRARLPAARRSLPKNFEVDAAPADPVKSSSQYSEKEEVKGPRVGSFGGKKDEKVSGESPYAVVPEEKECEQRLETDRVNLAAEPSRSMPRFRQAQRNDNIGYFMTERLRVWCWLPNGQWELGHIQSTSGEKATVLLLDGTVVSVSTGKLLPANPDSLQGVDDLIQLSYLNEPSILHNLQNRYSRDMIYSKVGPLLIAINPFKGVECYGNDFVTAYRQKLFHNPHIYAVADAAYHEMMRDEANQSIIMSGESGAGKTETAKLAMQYLAAVGGGNGGVESKILQASCILEAFGNAKTSRNDNSSRFGKLIEIHFSATGKICGAQFQTFLLEKSRVVQLTCGERSYHIFYQLCSGVPSGLRDRLNLKQASEYNYLNQSNCLAIDDVNDAQKFQMLMDAFATVQICEEDQQYIFEMLAAVLWLGNISFQATDNESHVEVVVNEAVSTVSRLMGCSTEDLVLALSTCRIQTGKDRVARNLTLRQAIDARDALAKVIYANLFDWLVEELNKLLVMGKLLTGRSISILDIYGFESFKKNSFEQFCINYANERLQQHFIRHLIKLEQEEYELDGIDWTKVNFEDNLACLDLFEKVLYDTSGFLEKNRETLHSDTIQLLSACSSGLPKLFACNMLKQFQISPNPLHQMGVFYPQKQSVGSKFKGQLFKLMQQLESSTPHFILCIKPNTKHLPGLYEKDLVLEQLRCCGVLEVVRVSRSGYPTKVTHQVFAKRYGFLLLEDNASQDPLSISVAILQQFEVLPDMFRVGHTKLYFRTGQIAALEDTRKQVLQGTLEMKKRFSNHHAYCHFHEFKKGVIALQSIIRGKNARKEYDGMIKLREWAAQKTFEKQLTAIIHLQSVIRGWLARKHCIYLKRLKNSNPGSSKQKLGREISEVTEVLHEKGVVLSSVLEDLQRRVSQAEATLGQKEQENAALREQLQQCATRWSEYEEKMKSMEDMWQKQMASLQVSLDTARKSLAADSTAVQPGRLDDSPSSHYYDSEDTTFMGAQTSGGNTPNKISYTVRDIGAGQEANGGLNPVSHLVKEFEQRKQGFDDEAKAIAEIKSGHPDEDFRKLKLRFEMWKKEYKSRLQKTKAKLHKRSHSEVEKSRWTWWGKKR